MSVTTGEKTLTANHVKAIKVIEKLTGKVTVPSGFEVVEVGEYRVKAVLRAFYGNIYRKQAPAFIVDWRPSGGRESERFSILPVWPRYRPDGYDFSPSKSHAISVSASRSVESLVADIERRFLPKYLDECARQNERMQDYAIKRERQLNDSQRLAAILGASCISNGRPMSGFRAYRHGIKQVEVLSGGTVKIETDSSIPIELAEEILELLAARLPVRS